METPPATEQPGSKQDASAGAGDSSGAAAGPPKPPRFATATEADLERQVNKNTSRATNRDVKTLDAWAQEKGYADFDVRKLSKADLVKHLALHFAELRTEGGELYARSSLDAKKNSIQRYLREQYDAAPDDAKPSYGPNLTFASTGWTAPIMTAITNAMKKSAQEGPVDGAKKARHLDPDTIQAILAGLAKDPVTGEPVELSIESLRSDRYNFYKFLVTNLQIVGRGGEEQTVLCISMFSKTTANGQPALLFDKGVNKTWNGGATAGAKLPPVTIFPNTVEPRLCLVALLSAEIAWREKNMPGIDDKLKDKPNYYLQPKIVKVKGGKGATDDAGDTVYHVARFNQQVHGKNEIADYMKRLCSIAGFEKTTNHAVRRTGITAMLQTGASVKAVQSVTGHRSVDGLMAYHQVTPVESNALAIARNAAILGQHVTTAAVLSELQATDKDMAAAIVSKHRATMKPETATMKPETATIKPETATIKPETATMKPETATMKARDRLHAATEGSAPEIAWREKNMPGIDDKLKDKPNYYLQPKIVKVKGGKGATDDAGDTVYHVARFNQQVHGKNEIADYMKRLCSIAGFEKTTNHAVRRTGITAMLQTGASVKAVQSVTGHRSVDGLMAYHQVTPVESNALAIARNAAILGQHVTTAAVLSELQATDKDMAAVIVSKHRATMKPETATMKPETATMKPETATTKPETATMKPETASMPPPKDPPVEPAPTDSTVSNLPSSPATAAVTMPSTQPSMYAGLTENRQNRPLSSSLACGSLPAGTSAVGLAPPADHRLSSAASVQGGTSSVIATTTADLSASEAEVHQRLLRCKRQHDELHALEAETAAAARRITIVRHQQAHQQAIIATQAAHLQRQQLLANAGMQINLGGMAYNTLGPASLSLGAVSTGGLGMGLMSAGGLGIGLMSAGGLGMGLMSAGALGMGLMGGGP
ncbi:hypothetical protein GPECTOR_24g254 [Gonium pectorale]|uniref:Tyr recombinase domain-containing protein n=1 Tax=Gonium pectorale TaxID=33097 RepID=A0A150GGL7_GONPE|nr:hypothetical protein GPECTOR_24g254 [Gonium pectorale]|eukprot:KXZ48964.1 hypothetical protein GPECTOR_24g254 [Gonium pectorale]